MGQTTSTVPCTWPRTSLASPEGTMVFIGPFAFSALECKPHSPEVTKSHQSYF